MRPAIPVGDALELHVNSMRIPPAIGSPLRSPNGERAHRAAALADAHAAQASPAATARAEKASGGRQLNRVALIAFSCVGVSTARRKNWASRTIEGGWRDRAWRAQQ